MRLCPIASAVVASCAASLTAQPSSGQPVGELRRPITSASATTDFPWAVRITLQAVNREIPQFAQPLVGRVQVAPISCTAIVLSSHWLLTSAHCLRGKSVHSWQLRVESTNAAGLQKIYPMTTVFGRASYYNHPDFDHDSDRGDDLGLVRLYGSGIDQSLAAPLYDGDDSPWRRREEIWVAGYGLGTSPGEPRSCDSGQARAGRKRSARFALTGDVDHDGLFGRGPAIAVQANTNRICPGDSGAPWMVGRNGHHAVLAVHSGTRQALSWSDKEWATLIQPKFEWILRTTKEKGLPLRCVRDRRGGIAVRRCRNS